MKELLQHILSSSYRAIDMRFRPTGDMSMLIKDVALNSLHPHVISACMKLNIPDHLNEKPLSARELSDRTKVERKKLVRLIRAMRLFDIVTKTRKGTYKLTRTGKYLTSDSTLAKTLKLMGNEWAGEFAQLPELFDSGKRSPQSKFKGNFFAYSKKDQELADCFNEAMVESEESITEALLGIYDFSPFAHVVDVGGGQGRFMLAILNKYPEVEGTVLDNETNEENDLFEFKDRCRFIVGNFFARIPPGGDLYILKNILHDWSDEKALEILKNLRSAMGPGTKLLVITMLMPEEDLDLDLIYMDMLMLTVFDGKERTLKEHGYLLAETGFSIIRCEKITGSYYFVEAEAT